MAEMNIFQKMLKIEEELGVVAKNISLKAGKDSYKAVSERDIIDAVKPIEAKYGVYSYPVSRTVLESEKIENEATDYNGNTIKKITFRTRIEVVYRFVNTDNPDDFIDITSYGDGFDPQDKGPGKAMTYADKYALMKAYKISTGDDPDQEVSKEFTVPATNSKSPNKAPECRTTSNKTSAHESVPEAAPEASRENYTCERCGKVLFATRKKDGSLMMPDEIAALSKQKHGLVLCSKCLKELAAVENENKNEEATA